MGNFQSLDDMFTKGGYTIEDRGHMHVATKTCSALSYRYTYDDNSHLFYGRLERLDGKMKTVMAPMETDYVMKRGYQWAQRRLREIMYDYCRYE